MNNIEYTYYKNTRIQRLHITQEYKNTVKLDFVKTLTHYTRIQE